MSVADLKEKAEKLRGNLESLRGQLVNLEQSEPSDDLTTEVQRQAAIATARNLISERSVELEQQEAAVIAAELEERKNKAIAALLKRAARAAERYNDSVMSLSSALGELNAVNEESIGIGNGAMFAAVGIVKVPPMVVKNSGNGYRMGTV